MYIKLYYYLFLDILLITNGETITLFLRAIKLLCNFRYKYWETQLNISRVKQ